MTQANLGAAYVKMPGGDRQANLAQAIACCEAALEIYTRAAFPESWAWTQTHLGNAYVLIPGRDQQAIACHKAALEIYTRDAFPHDWAETQHNLGNTYVKIPGGNRQANLERAMACFEVALEVFRSTGMDSNAQIARSDLEAAQDEWKNLQGSSSE